MLVVFCWYVFEATTEAVARINPFNAVVVEVGRSLHVHQALGDLLGNAQEILIQTAVEGNLLENRPPHRKQWKHYYFPGTGASGEKQIVAFDMDPPYRPPKAIVDLRNESFRSAHRAIVLPALSPALKTVLLCLDSIVAREITTRDWLGVGSAFHEQFVLGYVAFYRTPLEVVVGWHTDPPNECDVAANFVYLGSSVVGVGKENSQVEVKTGDMYIFCPNVDAHMVGPPLTNQERFAVSLRYYKQDRQLGNNRGWAPTILDKEERAKRMEGFLDLKEKGKQNSSLAGIRFWQCNDCGTPVPDHYTLCVQERCRAPRGMGTLYEFESPRASEKHVDTHEPTTNWELLESEDMCMADVEQYREDNWQEEYFDGSVDEEGMEEYVRGSVDLEGAEEDNENTYTGEYEYGGGVDEYEDTVNEHSSEVAYEKCDEEKKKEKKKKAMERSGCTVSRGVTCMNKTVPFRCH